MSKPEGAEGAVLDQIERHDRLFRVTLIGAAVVESSLILLLLLLINFKDRNQVLILVSTLGVYNLLGIGLTVLAIYGKRNTLRVLKALEGLRPKA
jgi:hypothetical protein